MGNAYIKSQQQEQSSVPVLTGDRPLVASAPGGWLFHGVWLMSIPPIPEIGQD